MTLEQYAAEVANSIHSANYESEVAAIVRDAAATLTSSNISATNRDWFWNRLRELLEPYRYDIRKQGVTALSAIIAAAQAAIAQQAKNEKASGTRP